MTDKRVADVLEEWNAVQEGTELFEAASSLYPICRSITGNGLRQSLRLLQRIVPLELHEVPSGTPVFDWVVPREWNISDAYIQNANGERVVDFRRSSLHVLNYSIPVHKRMTLSELRPHLFTLPESPDWIPYRTSYYRDNWGFCLSHHQLQQLNDAEYEVRIDSSLEPGYLTYGEFRIQGATNDEVLISTHSCHPALCNDNLSGMVVAARLARALAGASLRYSYRFLWIPGTIGAITWLARNESRLDCIKHGLVLSCIGDPGPFTYKRSRTGTAEIDQVVEHVLRHSTQACTFQDFTPTGYDERQYCSPGIDLPMGCFMRTPNGRYPEYHTSADNLNLITPGALAESLHQLLRVIRVLEENVRLLNTHARCEPQLGKRGLYQTTGGTSNTLLEEALLWVLNFSDGSSSILDISKRSKVDFHTLSDASRLLVSHQLLVDAHAGLANHVAKPASECTCGSTSHRPLFRLSVPAGR